MKKENARSFVYYILKNNIFINAFELHFINT